jgi:hypothetical protein
MKRLLLEEAAGGASDGASGTGGGTGTVTATGGTDPGANANNGASGSGGGQATSTGSNGSNGQGTGTSEASSTTAATTAAPVGTEGPWYAKLYGADGKLDKKAFERLPDHLKGHKDVFSKYDSVEALLGGMGNLATLAGRKALAPLPENAPDEVKAERAALLRSINAVPEKPEGYEFNAPADYPKEYWNPDYANGVKALLHKHNAPPGLAKELLAHTVAIAKGNLARNEQAAAQAAAAEKDAIKKAFGSDYDAKMDKATRAARTFGLDPERALASSELAVALSRIGEQISEDRLVSSDGKAGDGMSDRQKARDIVTNSANPLHKAYHNTEDPGHEEALRTVETFNKRAAAAKKK